MGDGAMKPGQEVVRLVPHRDESEASDYFETVRMANEFVDANGCRSVSIVVVADSGEIVTYSSSKDRLGFLGALVVAIREMSE